MTVSARPLGLLLLVPASLLACWTMHLATTLGPGEHRWHWVGLDVLEVLALVGLAALLLRGRRLPVAALALLVAPLFGYDALLDISSSHHSTPDLVMATAMALGVELPTCCGLVWLAVSLSRHALRREPLTRNASVR